MRPIDIKSEKTPRATLQKGRDERGGEALLTRKRRRAPLPPPPESER